MALALTGGAVGLLGGYIQQREQAQALTDFKSDIQRIFRNAEKKRTEERERFLGLETSQLGTQYLLDAFRDPLGGGLAQEYGDRVRSAQAARGFGSGGGSAGSVQEASFLARMADQRRQQLLPVLNLFEQQAQDAGQAAFNRKAAFAQTIAGVGPGPGSGIGASLQQGVAGFFGGMTLANEYARLKQLNPGAPTPGPATLGQYDPRGFNTAGAGTGGGLGIYRDNPFAGISFAKPY